MRFLTKSEKRATKSCLIIKTDHKKEIKQESPAFLMKNRTFLYNVIQLFIGHKDYSKFLLAIHFHNNRRFKAYMTEIFGFKYGGLSIQELLIVYSIIHKRVNREISHTKRSQVLEEMRSLTGIYR